MIDTKTLTITEARKKLKAGEFTARELVEACLAMVKERDGELHAFLEVYDDVLSQADEADKKIKAGEDAPLLGIPLAIKDNILMKGKISSASSKILENYIATYDSTVVKKLREAGAVIIGRTNCDEFAMGSSTENSAYGPSKNPYDLTRVPGGSSGGSAVAVATGMVLGAYGSDTGGSIRQPASFCGIVGMKPTYGRVSRSGLIALGSSLDQIGPFAKTIADTELLYEIVKGQDLMDSTTIGDEIYTTVSKKFSKTIGIPRSFVESEGVDELIKKNFQETIEKFKKLGYKIKDIELEHAHHALSVYYIIMPAEASSNLARFDGVKYGLHKGGKTVIEDYFKTRAEGFGVEVRRRIILGTYVLSSGYYDEYYGSAIKMKRLITDEYRRAFEKVDLILTPTTPTPAFKLGEKTSDPLMMYLADIFTVPANISGCPSVSLPSGFSGKLPLGIELTADLGREDSLFVAGKEFLGM
ncbi:MAG: Asp-tRNA(Asn)/Glu-tRNA(Gln) amidotransferase subunit GatA [bacterium]